MGQAALSLIPVLWIFKKEKKILIESLKQE